jgi:tRNA A-37 threonylcarbamoyl transferase component Bud32
MTGNGGRLTQVIAAIASGDALDWESVWPAADNSKERRLLDQLRIIEYVAAVHRQSAPLAGACEISPAQALPTQWGHLEIRRVLGRGASAVVCSAWDPALSRDVALKLLERCLDASDSDVLLREARLLARIRHQAVVQVYGADCFEGRAGLWMERIDGRTLDELIREHGPFAPREALLIAADVCSALAAVHRAGLVHRDIKAQNIMRENGGRIVLMDFGTGTETMSENGDDRVQFAGTPLYVAPELFAGSQASVRSDIYSVGVLLFRLVTAQFPVAADTVRELRRAHELNARHRLRDARSGLAPAFVQVVERALDVDPSRRFESAGEMEAALEAVLAGGAMHASADRVVPPPAPRRGRIGDLVRRPVPAWAGVGLLLLGFLVSRAWPQFIPWWPHRSPGPGRTGSYAADATPREANLTPQQRSVAAALEELAASSGSRGEWGEAESLYRRIVDLYRESAGIDSPLRALASAKLAFAQQRLGRLDDAKRNYELALYFLGQEVSEVHPLAAVITAALAALHQNAGRFGDAAAAVRRAIEIRARMLDPNWTRGRSRTGAMFEPDRLERLMATYSLERDGDGDWLPDLIEAALGLDPNDADTDRNGVPDGSDKAEDGPWSNFEQFGLTTDPIRTVAHYGSVNPARLGFAAFSPNPPGDHAERAAVNGDYPAWTVEASSQFQLIFSVPRSLEKDAVSRGWRLSVRATAHAGGGGAVFDLTPFSRRFDVFYRDGPPSHLSVGLNALVVPYQAAAETVRRQPAWPMTELVFDPREGGATFFVDGTRSLAGFQGHSQYQENPGLTLSSAVVDGSHRSAIDFNLVMLTIR